MMVFALEALYQSLKTSIEASWTVPFQQEPLVKVDYGKSRMATSHNVGRVGRVMICPGLESGQFATMTGPKQWGYPIDAPGLVDVLSGMELDFRIYIYGRCPNPNPTPFDIDHWAFRVQHETIRQVVLAQSTWGTTSPIKLGPINEIKPEAQLVNGREWIWSCKIEQPILNMFEDDLSSIDVAPLGALVTTTTNGQDTDQAIVEPLT